ncbi:hypothetical protein K9M74_01300 [Candidatus Woesearchaeota archaeon]|nr:hypothetical protein [Candidatus Woesearchaeota archaeon]
MKHGWHGFVVIVGFALSPLSWWNDLFVNIPLAYVFSLPFSLISKKLFIPSFVVGYLLTNILGFYLMHRGFKKILNSPSGRKEFRRDIIIAFLYTLLIIILGLTGVIKAPVDLFT